MISTYRKGKVQINTPKEIGETVKRRSGWKIYFPKRSKLGFVIAPTLLFLVGAVLIGSQTLPGIKFFIQNNFSYKYAETISPVWDDKEENENTPATFESQYFSSLLSKLKEENKTDFVAGVSVPYMYDWSGKFYLSVPTAGISDMVVTANVDSYNEDTYNAVLKSSVAHFAGTDLPAPLSYSKDTNTFIYGHSAPGSWSALHGNSFDAAFNPLFDVNVGDEVFIKFEENTYTYKITKIKVAKPSDLNTLKSQKGKHIITLMTCAPPGSTANRLTITAEQLN